MKGRKWISFAGMLLWCEFFIALPAGLGIGFSRVLTSNPHYQALCLRAGIWGLVLGTALPILPCMMIGALLGYSIGTLISSRIHDKERFAALMLAGKEVRFFSPLTRWLLGIAAPTIPDVISASTPPIASPFAELRRDSGEVQKHRTLS